MKSFKIFIAITCLGFTALVTEAFITIKNNNIAKPAASGKGFAVVELFTSEGCSSCPPADALVARVQKESTDKPVYILAFHVDYWNRLGWKDVFSSHEYSERQNQYARWLNLSSVYTPQAVVNGHTEFVGSEEANLRSAIKAGLERTAKTELSLSNVKIEGDKAVIQYKADGATSNSDLLIALIEKNATTKVQRGENGGRTLSHVQIVTQLKSISLKNSGNGTESIALPHGFDPQKWELIGFVQNTSNGEITGATKAQFPTNVSAKL
ncbi:MAG TPA: DUF1223 domain-containing protein [Mucilaginibacter sp.]|jgi:hypothetical protein|nr:DUF1223 domain-containing protein [Mucilaginibacter sp.]